MKQTFNYIQLTLHWTLVMLQQLMAIQEKKEVTESERLMNETETGCSEGDPIYEPVSQTKKRYRNSIDQEALIRLHVRYTESNWYPEKNQTAHHYFMYLSVMDNRPIIFIHYFV